MPLYNAAATVGRTLASVQALTEINWHCIVVDDGSTDNNAGADLVRSIQAADPRFILISKPNRGLSSARNAGLDYLQTNPAHRGTHVLLLDADDCVLAPGMQRLMTHASAHSTSLVGHFQVIDSTDHPLRAQTIPVARLGLAELLDLPFVVPNAMLHRWQDIAPHRFANSRRKIEDYDLYFRMALAGVVWTTIDEPVAAYRISANSMSHDFGACLRDGQAVITEAFTATRAAASPGRTIDTSASRELATLGKQALNWSTREAICGGGVGVAHASALLQAAPGIVPTGEDFLAGCIDSAVLLGLGLDINRQSPAALWPKVLAWCAALEHLGHFAPGLAHRLLPLLDACSQSKAAAAAEMLAQALDRTPAHGSLTVFGYGTIGREFIKQSAAHGGVTINIRDTRLDAANPAHAASVPAGTTLQPWDSAIDPQTLCILTIAADASFLDRTPLNSLPPQRLLRWSAMQTPGPWALAVGTRV